MPHAFCSVFARLDALQIDELEDEEGRKKGKKRSKSAKRRESITMALSAMKRTPANATTILPGSGSSEHDGGGSSSPNPRPSASPSPPNDPRVRPVDSLLGYVEESKLASEVAAPTLNDSSSGHRRPSERGQARPSPDRSQRRPSHSQETSAAAAAAATSSERPSIHAPHPFTVPNGIESTASTSEKRSSLPPIRSPHTGEDPVRTLSDQID